MNKWLKFIGVGILFLGLVGGLALMTQNTRAAATDPTGVGTELLRAVKAQTLTLALPAIIPVKAVEGAVKYVDLLPYTDYDGDPATLAFSATEDSSYVEVAVVQQHYLQLTSLTEFAPRRVDVTVQVSDGVSTTEATFEALVESPPSLDFYTSYVYNNVPNPVSIYAGQQDTIRIGEDRNPIYLEYYTSDDSSTDILTYTIANSPTADLGAFIYEGKLTGCDYDYCTYLIFSPTVKLYGTHFVTVQVEDSTGFTATDMVTASVLQRIFVPPVLRKNPLVPVVQPISNPDGDGDYTVRWTLDVKDVYVTYEVEYATNPQFTGGVKSTTGSQSKMVWIIQPATYYWRVRALWDNGSSAETGPWSNVQSVSVGNFAYLYVEALCAYDLDLTLSGSAGTFTQRFSQDECNDTNYWRSVPVGSYTTRLAWVNASIVDTVPATALNNGEYVIRAGDRPASWQPY